jgi:hypothetical protein
MNNLPGGSLQHAVRLELRGGSDGEVIVRAVIASTIVLLLAACASVTGTTSVFSVADFSHLRFLEGRWEGTGPDGKTFYEQYSFPSRIEMHANRFADATFAEVQDGSVVALENGRVTSTWNQFTWEASELTPGKACFVPVNAPSSFCWESLSPTTAQVIQRWTDEHGKRQQYVVPLRRF